MGFLSSVFILNAGFDQETAWDDIYNKAGNPCANPRKGSVLAIQAEFSFSKPKDWAILVIQVQ